jgi:methionyl-tRNA formyltransferase
MLLALLPRLLAGERPGRPQPRSDEPVLRRRRPADGDVDWEQPARRIYDFVRALTRPYPGAFSILDGRCLRLWRAAFNPADAEGRRPGEVVGPVLSPDADACGQVVATAGGTLTLLEVEAENGLVLRGQELARQDWTGKIFHANHTADVG